MVPTIPDEEMTKTLQEASLEAERKAGLIKWVEMMESGLIFVESIERGEYIYNRACNLFLSKCFNCSKFAVWVHDQLVHPTAIGAPLPNPDLPPDVFRDYQEAGRIVGESPRGAAALLRLAIQKLCLELGEKGERIDDDIASLVKKGLIPTVQKAMDIVRVIGNEAVHPGILDLRDDRDTAIKLFKLVNIISEQMISNPKHVEEIYGQLPEGKRKAIEKRDSKA
ncbi:MAG: DUF4145 domain-containing protein [Nitrospirales bacterium]